MLIQLYRCFPELNLGQTIVLWPLDCTGPHHEHLAFVLCSRYGKTTMSKKLYFDKLAQKSSETIYDYADRM